MAQFNENIELLNAAGITVKLTNELAEMIAGGNDTFGIVRLYNTTGDNNDPAQANIQMDGSQATVSIGGQTLNGSLSILNETRRNRIVLNGSEGDIRAGASDTDGDLYLFRSNGNNDNLGEATMHLNGQIGDLTIGGNGTNGDIFLKATDSRDRVRLLGSQGNLWLGGNGQDGDIVLFRSSGDNSTLAQTTIHLNGQGGDLAMGGNGVNGDIKLKNAENNDRVRLKGDANLWLGGNGADEDIVMFKTTGDNKTLSQSTVHIDGEIGDLILGSNGVNGDIKLKSKTNQDRIRLLGSEGNLWLGGNGADGDIVLFKESGDNTTLSEGTIHMNGESGNIRCNDVIISGADFAEDFDIDATTAKTLEPGTVMVLGKDGKPHESTEAFDHKVAGVVSGAGKYNVGITLDKQPNSKNRMPIALSGKVMCKIDANYGEIEVGDLITTSPRKGYAMKAKDPLKAFGAVIGKALADFPSGDGMLPILVALQ